MSLESKKPWPTRMSKFFPRVLTEFTLRPVLNVRDNNMITFLQMSALDALQPRAPFRGP